MGFLVDVAGPRWTVLDPLFNVVKFTLTCLPPPSFMEDTESCGWDDRSSWCDGGVTAWRRTWLGA